MKRLFALMAVVLAVVSCQKDVDSLDVNMGGNVATISVTLPENAITRAAADETNSAWSGLQNVKEETLRVIFQVYDENGVTNENLRQEKTLTEGETSANFDVRLVPDRQYTFVAWADQGEEYFDTADLKDVKILDWKAMDECRDAYTATHTEEKFNSASNITLTLTRPFAKLRVITTDMEQLGHLNIAPAEAEVQYTVALPNAFNAFAGEAGTTTTNKTFANFDIAEYNQDAANTKTLFTDYILVPANNVVKFSLKTMQDGGREIKTNNFTTDIPVKRNNLTTITGDILTDGNNIKVEVDEEFEKENTIFNAFVNGGTVTLDKDYELGSTLYVESGVKATLNLNGKTLKSLYDADNYTDVIVVEEGAELTINGEGTIEAEGGKSNFTVIVDGKLTINGGTFKSGVDEVNDPNAVFYVRGNGEAYVNGGNFPNELNSKYILNKKDADRATTTIEVRGGRFQNFDPANNAAENAGTNFVVDGYVSVAKDGWYEVVSKDSIAIDNVDDFKAAIASGVETINIKGGVVFEGVFEFTSMNQNTTIICHNTEDKAVIKGRVNISNCNPTFIGVKFDTNDDSKAAFTLTGWSGYQYEAIVGIHTTGGATFNNCSFNYQDTSAITNANGFIKVTNCDFVGNSQFAIYSRANIEITDSTVKVTVPDGYESVAGFIHLNALANGKAIVKNITGCCHNGADMGHPICFGSTNNDANGVWVGPVTFDVQGNTGFTYPFYKLNSVKISHEDHIFADGSKKFTWTY